MNLRKIGAGMAVLSILAGGLSACSKLQGDKSSTYILTTTLSPKDGALTRSTMTDTGAGIAAAWEVGDYIWVSYDDNGNTYPTARAKVTAVDGSGNATISVALSDPKDGGNIQFGFPYLHWAEGYGLQTGQAGTLDQINREYASIMGNGSLSVSGGVASLPVGVAMEPETCIWKFSFSDGSSDITSSITRLSIVLSNGYYDDEYVIIPESWGPNPLYVALYSTWGEAKTVTITVTTPSGNYHVSKSGITLEAGKLYTSTGLVVTE